MTESAIPVRMPRRRFPVARAVSALVLREMSTTYGRSPGGYVWAVVEPVAAISFLSIAFSFFTHMPPLGQSFVLFYATGFLPLAAFQSISGAVASAIRFSRQLLSYPTVTYVDAILARLVLNILTQSLVFLIVITGVSIVSDTGANIDPILILRAWGMVIALGTGVGLLNCFLTSMFPVWQLIWSVLTRPLFLVSGVVYLVDGLKEQAREYALMIPPAHFIMMMRRGFYDYYTGAYVSEQFIYGLSLILAVLGMVLLHRYHRLILTEKK